MLEEVRWCHAGQVTLCAEPSCHWAEAVPQEFQSVIIILMTCIALQAMSSLVCAKANEQRPNCKINWKTFWLKTTLTTLSFHSSFTDWSSFLLIVLSPFFLYQHAPDITLFFTCNLFFLWSAWYTFLSANCNFFTVLNPPTPAPDLFFVFSHQTPSCAAVSCIFSSRLHYCLFLQLHCVCLCICMQWGTYKRTCSFLFTAPPTPLILNFFREWPVPFYSPFASYQQSLRVKMERGNLYSQCCLLLSHLILLLLLFLCTETLHIHTFLLLFLCTRLMSFVNHTFLAITCHVPERIPTVSVQKSTS